VKGAEGRCHARNASRSDAGGHSASQLARKSTPPIDADMAFGKTRRPGDWS
jgi:hypothetical protein